jgi:hypothetical protein
MSSKTQTKGASQSWTGKLIAWLDGLEADIVTAPDVARKMGLSVVIIESMIRRKQLPSLFVLNRKVRVFDKAALREALESLGEEVAAR